MVGPECMNLIVPDQKLSRKTVNPSVCYMLPAQVVYLLISPVLQVLCVRICMLYSTMGLAGWPLSCEAARRRCGSELLSDLIFVCGDRGIYVGKSLFKFPIFLST